MIENLFEMVGWIFGILAGLSLAMVLGITLVVYLVVFLTRINARITKLENRVIVENRDMSFRVKNIENGK